MINFPQMRYKETLDRIHSFQRFGSRLGLERMSILMEYLGNPQDTMRVIHVGGTNGKGSVCRYIYSVLQKNGYSAGLYTSPYIERFTERIECNGCEISQEDLIRYTNRLGITDRVRTDHSDCFPVFFRTEY